MACEIGIGPAFLRRPVLAATLGFGFNGEAWVAEFLGWSRRNRGEREGALRLPTVGQAAGAVCQSRWPLEGGDSGKPKRPPLVWRTDRPVNGGMNVCDFWRLNSMTRRLTRENGGQDVKRGRVLVSRLTAKAGRPRLGINSRGVSRLLGSKPAGSSNYRSGEGGTRRRREWSPTALCGFG